MNDALPPSRSRRWSPVVAALVLLNAVPELVLQAADAGWIGSPNWRLWALSYGALWRGLLFDWRPNFALQPLTMFVTYGFLHAGIGHLAGNILGLLVLAPETLRRTGSRGLAAVCAAALLAGAFGFVLLSASPRPMIGASGAVYGLAAAWIHWDWRDRRRGTRPTLPVLIWVLGLALTNAVSWWALAGQLAWQTHAGGAVGGWLCAWWLDPDRAQSPRNTRS